MSLSKRLHESYFDDHGPDEMDEPLSNTYGPPAILRVPSLRPTASRTQLDAIRRIEAERGLDADAIGRSIWGCLPAELTPLAASNLIAELAWRVPEDSEPPVSAPAVEVVVIELLGSCSWERLTEAISATA